MVPIGVAMGRPPAKGVPPLAVWQATQSPARARYSPFLISASSVPWAANTGKLVASNVAIAKAFMGAFLCLNQWARVFQILLADRFGRPVGQGGNHAGW